MSGDDKDRLSDEQAAELIKTIEQVEKEEADEQAAAAAKKPNES